MAPVSRFLVLSASLFDLLIEHLTPGAGVWVPKHQQGLNVCARTRVGKKKSFFVSGKDATARRESRLLMALQKPLLVLKSIGFSLG